MNIASIARPGTPIAITPDRPRPGTPPVTGKPDDWCGTPVPGQTKTLGMKAVPAKPEPCFPWGVGPVVPARPEPCFPFGFGAPIDARAGVTVR